MKPFNKDSKQKKIREIGSKINWDSTRKCDYLDDYLNINAINLDLSETIYRIFDWNYFIEDLNDKKLTLPNTKKWLNQDPFESFIINSKVSHREKFGKIDNSYFGLCWTLQSDCDGLWRNFSSNKRKCVVKAKRNAKKLFKAIYDINKFNHSNKYYIGKVKYIKENSISNFFSHS